MDMNSWICRRMPGDLRSHIIDYFDFIPSRDAAIVALSLFLAVSLAVFIITVKTRAWFMVIPTIVGERSCNQSRPSQGPEISSMVLRATAAHASVIIQQALECCLLQIRFEFKFNASSSSPSGSRCRPSAYWSGRFESQNSTEFQALASDDSSALLLQACWRWAAMPAASACSPILSAVSTLPCSAC